MQLKVKINKHEKNSRNPTKGEFFHGVCGHINRPKKI